MKTQLLATAFVVIVSLSAGAQDAIVTKKPTQPFKYTVEAAPEWTELFKRNQGWFGADGIFSIPLSGIDKNNNEGNDATLLLFSDTYIGEVRHGKPLPGSTMVNNTIAYMKGNDPDPTNISFYYKTGDDGKPTSIFVPRTSTAARPQLFWLGDGFVNQELNDELYIFGYKVERTGPGAFDFIEPQVSIIAIPKGSRPPFAEQRQIQTSLHIKSDQVGEGNFGAGVLVNTRWAGAPVPDGYVYVYGCAGKDKNLVVARVEPKYFESLQEWRYWDGKGWNESKDALKPLVNSVSDELSMTPLPDGRFLLIFQVLGLSDKVGMRIADSPVGPFSEIKEIWTAPEWKAGLWTYNAKAHFNLSKPGELLISYNTIKDDFWNAIQKDASIYRPRFIRLKFEMK
jgi:hypothetical protein